MALLELGLTNRQTVTVTEDLSPPHLAPMVVLSTPEMIRLMEETCTGAIQPLIEADDRTSVGTHVNVSHEAAATGGDEVAVSCELIEIDRRRLTFLVEARVGDRIIGRGTHQRHIIDRSRFAR
jgi:fluoroacetyl-CoA thioesterase